MTKQLSISNTTGIAGVSVSAFSNCNCNNSRSMEAKGALVNNNATTATKTANARSFRTTTATAITTAVAEASSSSSSLQSPSSLSSVNLPKTTTFISSVANTLTSISTSTILSISTSVTPSVTSNDTLRMTKRKYSLNNEQLTATITHIFKPKIVNIAGGSSSSSSSSSNDTNGRSAALERAYVHDVYENCEESSTGSLRPKVVQFLTNLEPGSVVCDVGCGSGRYLNLCNPFVCSVGVDRCCRLSYTAKQNGAEVALCDNLELPFRNECFDAVLSLAVIHHFATTERRVNALRELARILRIGGKVIITVWALEQKHRRFESQDVLIPWQPKSTYFNYSDDEDIDDFLPPYHAYTEDSNSSRSAGDGDSSSLSSSSPGESCYSFVRRAIKKLAGSSKQIWFLDSWILKDAPKYSSLDMQDAKDLPIELRGLENLDYLKDPKLTANLKSRSLGSILYPPTSSCEVVRSISSVPSLDTSALQYDKPSSRQIVEPTLNLKTFATNPVSTAASCNQIIPTATYTSNSISSASCRRPKLVKQKQSLYDDDFKLPDVPSDTLKNSSNITNDFSNDNHINANINISPKQPTYHSCEVTNTHIRLIKKQSSLNEELMAGNRIEEKERVRKRIQKQRSLNEAFLCRSTILTRKLNVIRESFSKKMKNSSDTLERATKNSLSKIMQNLKSSPEDKHLIEEVEKNKPQKINTTKCTHVHHHHHSAFHHHQLSQHQQHTQQPQSLSFQQHFPFVSNFQNHLQHFLQWQNTNNGSNINKFSGPVTICKNLECASTACYCAVYHHGCIQCNAEHCEEKARRHSRESGSDSSKDNSLQSDTSIESEDSFASVIYTPRPGQSQQQQMFQQQHQSSSSSNSSSSNGGASHMHANCTRVQCSSSTALERCCKIDRKCSVPTSPLAIACPQSPAQSHATSQTTATSPPKTTIANTAALDKPSSAILGSNKENEIVSPNANFKEHFPEKAELEVQSSDLPHAELKEVSKEFTDKNTKFLQIPNKITRQTIRDLPPIPKFRNQLTTRLTRQSFPIVRRSSSTTGVAIPAIPKLLSLELFNPATDDLDSDSSEASSPDSIDSVISAPKSNTVSDEKDEKFNEKYTDDKSETFEENSSNEKIVENLKLKSYLPSNDLDAQIHSKINQLHYQNDLSKNNWNANDNNNKATDKLDLQQAVENTKQFSNSIKTKMFTMNGNEGGNIKDYIDDPYFNYRKRYAQKDLTAIRDELRERRLMLANLSTESSVNQSSVSSSTSSLSSQTRSFIIHEEEEEEEDDDKTEPEYSLKLYGNLKNVEYNRIGNSHKYLRNAHSETTCLLQDEDASSRDEDDIENDVILEEDEDAENELLQNQSNENYSHSFENNINNQNKIINQDVISEPQLMRNNCQDSRDNSTGSTVSLDSPSQRGGNATHHRYYHVFREGELDALINHHVNNLHIVSSYYERANWCIVAEKVHVWTI